MRPALTFQRRGLAVAGLAMIAQRAAARPEACRAARWQTLPPTPSLPPARRTGRMVAGDASLWFAEFGVPSGEPVLLLHGGLANADYWGAVLPMLGGRRVIALDTRGHGRSTMGGDRLGYALFASDVQAVLDQLSLPRAAIVGWSDGGITGLALAMTAPHRVSRLFTFGANYDPSGLIPHGAQRPTFRQFAARSRVEYRALSPQPGRFDALVAALDRMWSSEPRYPPSELAKIGTPTTVADGEHDEVIAPRHTVSLAGAIPGARLVIQPCVSHFAMLQDPAAFGRLVLGALG